MNPPETNDPLDKLLQEPAPYLEDAGFTARVISALPSRPRVWRRPVLLLSVNLAGLILAYFWLPWHGLPSLDQPASAFLNLNVLLPWAVVAIVLATLIWGMVSACQLED